MLNFIKNRKIAIFAVALGFFAVNLPIKAQNTELFEENQIDLWQTSPQAPDTKIYKDVESERYYTPELDFNQNQKTPPEEKPTQIIIEPKPEEPKKDPLESIIEQLTQPSEKEELPLREPTGAEIGRYYITNITYGAAVGLLLGGLTAMARKPSFDNSFSYVGTGLVLGVVGGAMVALLKSNVLTRPVVNEEEQIKNDKDQTTLNSKYNFSNPKTLLKTKAYIPIFSANF